MQSNYRKDNQHLEKLIFKPAVTVGSVVDDVKLAIWGSFSN